MEQEKTVFEILSGINVNDKTEKKNDLTYLSWAWAWAEVKKIHNDCYYEVVKFFGLPYVHDPLTGYMVYTRVEIDGVAHEMWLPVMDGANKALKSEPYTYKSTKWVAGKRTEVDKTVEAATMTDINKTIMRCLTKNLAMFGLGLYIYAGEDMPESTEQTPKETPKEKQVAPASQTSELVELTIDDANWSKVKMYIDSNPSLDYDTIIKQLERKYKLKAAVKKEIKSLITTK